MSSQDDISHAADQFKDALNGAAAVMTVRDRPVFSPEGKVRRPGRWLLPLTAAMAVVVIALAAVFVSRLVRNAAPAGAPAGTTSTVPPKYYMTDDQDVGKFVLQVRRTADGAVTAAVRSPVDSGVIAAATTARAFFVAGVPNCTTALAVSKVYRITITDSGQISGMTVVGAHIQGMISELAVSPAGSQIAYTLAKTPRCNNHSSPAPATLLPQDVVRVMNLSTGSVQTWQNTATADNPTQVRAVSGLSWAPNGHTLVVEYQWAVQTVPLAAGQNLAALGLDTTSGGGSLQTHSHLLWHQDQNCVTCVLQVLAGPDDTLTADETQPVTQQQARQLIVRIPLAGGSPAIMYSALDPTPTRADITAIYADSSGQWVIALPLTDLSKPTWPRTRAGWISNGKLHPLPGATLVNDRMGAGIAW
jgi:hypothetical protein